MPGDRWTIAVAETDIDRKEVRLREVITNISADTIKSTVMGGGVPGIVEAATGLGPIGDASVSKSLDSDETEVVNLHIGTEQGLQNLLNLIDDLRGQIQNMQESPGALHSQARWDQLENQLNRVNRAIETVGRGSEVLAESVNVGDTFDRSVSPREFHRRYVAEQDFDPLYDPAETDTEVGIADIRPISEDPAQVQNNIEKTLTELDQMVQGKESSTENKGVLIGSSMLGDSTGVEEFDHSLVAKLGHQMFASSIIKDDDSLTTEEVRDNIEHFMLERQPEVWDTVEQARERLEKLRDVTEDISQAEDVTISEEEQLKEYIDREYDRQLSHNDLLGG